MFATRLNRVLRYFRQMHTYFNKLCKGTKLETVLGSTDNWPIRLQGTRKGLLVYSFRICTSHFKNIANEQAFTGKAKHYTEGFKATFFCINCVYQTYDKESLAHLPQGVKDSNPSSQQPTSPNCTSSLQGSKGTPAPAQQGSILPIHLAIPRMKSYTVLSSTP